MPQEFKDKMDWQIEIIRLTAILSSSPPPRNDLWSSVIGEEPDTSNEQRVPIAASMQQKNFDGFNLILQQLPNRVDWTLRPGPGLMPGGDSPLPALGDFQSSWKTFSSRILPKWIEFIPNATRLAVTGAAHVKYADLDAAKGDLQRIFGGFEIGTVPEFSLQMNRPKKSKSADDQQINMIQRWSVSPVLHIEMGSSSPQSRPVTRVDFDCNTKSASNRELSNAERTALIEELVSTVEDLFVRGEVL